jgi:murein DD-endopeptidase MepM/ murein hydrolase activator NlpD
MLGRRRSEPRSPATARFPIEVQLHPASIQRQVRCVFVQRHHAIFLVLAAWSYLTLLGYGLWATPAVVSGVAAQAEYDAQARISVRLRERTAGLRRRLAELETQSQSLELKVRKVYLAYGLERDSIGQGGYPGLANEVPDDPSHEQVRAATELLSGLTQQTEVLGAFLREVQYFEEQHIDQVRTTPSASPLRGEFLLTSPFGQRRNPFTSRPDFHAGIDLSAQRGTPVYAPASGRVAFAGRYDARRNVGWWRYGNLVSIRHGDDFVTLFGHLDAVKVRAGQQVEQGDLIGLVGNTGWSTNPHLHYEVRRRDAAGELRPVDPRVYILDHRWRDEEQLLVRARSAPDIGSYEPLPALIGR